MILKPSFIPLELSIILPCRNEQEALGECIFAIQEVLKKNYIIAEIIVSDSSCDGSPGIAKKYGVILIKHDKDGYGTAYLEGLKHARGKYIFCADPDGSYDFREIPVFLNYLREGYDFVIGNRFKGKMSKDAMPFLRRYVGNPVLSSLLKMFFGTGVCDTQCGMRAISKEALHGLKLKTAGMEFASEMVIKVIRKGLKIKELPIDYHKRLGKSKLRSFADGWRHLRFMLLYSPFFLFFVPGLTLFVLGVIAMVLFFIGFPVIGGVQLFYHPMFLAAVLVIVGYQLMIFALFAKTYAMTHLDEVSPSLQSMYRYVTIEKAGMAGILILLLGMIIYTFIFLGWIKSGFGALHAVKTSIMALTFIAVGVQTIFSAFMLSILGIKER